MNQSDHILRYNKVSYTQGYNHIPENFVTPWFLPGETQIQQENRLHEKFTCCLMNRKDDHRLKYTPAFSATRG